MAYQDNSRWRVNINGFEQGLAQNITFPEVSLNVMMVGSPLGLPDIKLPGKKKVTQLVIKKLKTTLVGTDRAFWDLLELAANGVTATGIFFCEIDLMDTTNIQVPVESYNFELGFVQAIQIDPLVRKADEQGLLYETVTIEPRNMIRVL